MGPGPGAPATGARPPRGRSKAGRIGLTGGLAGNTLTSRSITLRITTKGQVTIPLALREKLGLLPHTEGEVELDRDAVRLRKATTPGVTGRGRALVDPH